MPEINIKISNKVALCRKKYLISSNDDYTVVFDFDDEWKNHEAKTARFIFDSQYVDVAFIGNCVCAPKIIPCESLGIGVFSDSIASTVADIGCVLSVKDFSGTEADCTLTNDQYETLLSLLNSLDLRQIKTVTRIDKSIKIVYTDNSTSIFPIYDGVSVSDCAIDENGRLTLTLSDSTVLTAGNVKGSDGKDGEKGEKGETGATPAISIGTVQSVDFDEDAAASITGTKEAPVLNLSIPRGKSEGGGYYKKVLSKTFTEAGEPRSETYTTFADGTPLKYTELYIRGVAVSNLTGAVPLNVYYGWGGDSVWNRFMVTTLIPNFCQPSGTDVTEMEFSAKIELLGTKIFSQFNYAVQGKTVTTELRDSETDLFTQLAFWPGSSGLFQAGTRIEVYAR